MTETATLFDLSFELRRSNRRKTLGITVDRAGELVLHVPARVSIEQIAPAVRQKLLWIHRTLAERRTLQEKIRAKEFVSGESFHYLGRTYQLLLTSEAQTRPLLLRYGRFHLLRSEQPRAREHFVRWYSDHALPWLSARVEPWARRIGVRPTKVAIQDLGFRWASCGKGGGVNFHWKTILLPPGIIDYTIAHEVVHLLHHDHGLEFQRALARAMPDHQERQRWLAEHGARFCAL
jgi:predicted metal-dependent hydrolase